MNKLIKYTLIATISFNVLGGTYLGLQEYSEDKEAKKSFNEFYNTDTAVMGAYDKKPSGIPDGYIFSGIAVFVGLASVGAVYSVIRRERLKKSKKNLGSFL